MGNTKLVWESVFDIHFIPSAFLLDTTNQHFNDDFNILVWTPSIFVTSDGMYVGYFQKFKVWVLQNQHLYTFILGALNEIQLHMVLLCVLLFIMLDLTCLNL